MKNFFKLLGVTLTVILLGILCLAWRSYFVRHYTIEGFSINKKSPCKIMREEHDASKIVVSWEARYLYSLGNCHFSEREYPQAIEAYTAALRGAENMGDDFPLFLRIQLCTKIIETYKIIDSYPFQDRTKNHKEEIRKYVQKIQEIVSNPEFNNGK